MVNSFVKRYNNAVVDYELLNSVIDVQHVPHGLYVDSCLSHCMVCRGGDRYHIWNSSTILAGTTSVSGIHMDVNPYDAFRQWYTLTTTLHHHTNTIHSLKHRVYMQNEEYPCMACCACKFEVNG